MKDKLVNKLEELQRLFAQGGDAYYVPPIQDAISNGEESIWQYICSNELWGCDVKGTDLFSNASPTKSIFITTSVSRGITKLAL